MRSDEHLRMVRLRLSTVLVCSIFPVQMVCVMRPEEAGQGCPFLNKVTVNNIPMPRTLRGKDLVRDLSPKLMVLSSKITAHH